MSRSQAIWIVMDTASLTKPIAAFTVWHELTTWFGKQNEVFQRRLKIYRYENPMHNCGGRVYGSGSSPEPREVQLPIGVVINDNE